jgi:hypothetical protein
MDQDEVIGEICILLAVEKRIPCTAASGLANPDTSPRMDARQA